MIYASSFGNNQPQELHDAVADPSGNVYIAGSWTGVSTIDGLTAWLHGCTGPATEHAFVAKLSSTGAVVWAECLNAVAKGLAVSYDVMSQTVALGGSFTGTLSDYPTGSMVSSQGGTDGFVAILSHAGVRLGVAVLGGPLDDRVTGVVATPSEVFVAGTFQGTATFGATQKTASSGEDLFLARTTIPSFTFVKTFTETATAPTAKLTAGTATTLQLAGDFDGSMDFGVPAMPGALVANGRDAYLATFDTSGNATFAARYGDAGDDAITDVVANATKIGVAGLFAQQVDLDVGGAPGLTAVDAPDGFLAILATNHAVSAQKPIGASGPQRLESVAIDGQIVLGGGGFTGTVSFDGTPLTALDEDGFGFHADASGAMDWVVKFGGNTAGDQRITAVDHANIPGGLNFFGGTINAGFQLFNGTTIDHVGNGDILVAFFKD